MKLNEYTFKDILSVLLFKNYRKPRGKLLQDINELMRIQGESGNWNYDSYMHGMYNGMELIVAMVENREPVFKDKPKKWVCDMIDLFEKEEAKYETK